VGAPSLSPSSPVLSWLSRCLGLDGNGRRRALPVHGWRPAVVRLLEKVLAREASRRPPMSGSGLARSPDAGHRPEGPAGTMGPRNDDHCSCMPGSERQLPSGPPLGLAAGTWRATSYCFFQRVSLPTLVLLARFRGNACGLVAALTAEIRHMASVPTCISNLPLISRIPPRSLDDHASR
jgi:hypothetical protein